jgi:hypothetical protein
LQYSLSKERIRALEGKSNGLKGEITEVFESIKKIK